jgi:hypothetical protein
VFYEETAPRRSNAQAVKRERVVVRVLVAQDGPGVDEIAYEGERFLRRARPLHREGVFE